ncbi:hypothetical protein U1E44_16125, partial [Arenibacter sp. GZD96]|uniref:hypothetical protein n=1 Tax=Aurantibrevibacter litoralis TaxID=3106030 RepID=UPI002AFEE4BD
MDKFYQSLSLVLLRSLHIKRISIDFFSRLSLTGAKLLFFVLICVMFTFSVRGQFPTEFEK